ncbi:MAG TPA: hypothetical protein DDX39_06430 [Bacteroidales bacterium]|nr:MAG: hypothetical protein A2W98_05135 [Bacteroidetes bacterium GWF2_33_38]OFY75426.1 MAG: hypothetical protein A2265_12275 [Bacteroidetes bacterium RIFOXYA12_FULL_33_9]OFY87442.1 MAG: hypothetical protein A2236_04705 [Bacteroidetes bacterium RIFOXYA2_FULL_33_7]HBF88262.1 hypothetical protein [Bacteroidales bacterium]
MQNYKSILEPESFYHIYNRANGCEQLFRSDENYFYFLRQYDLHITPIAKTLAYCLMPNHFHFLVQMKQVPITNLQGFKNLEGFYSKQFSNLFNSYTKSYNKKFNRKGSLFIPRFNRKKINLESYLQNTINYIHQNPVLHNLADEIDEWKYSSYNAFIDSKPTKLDKEFVIELFDDKDNFVAFHKEKSITKFAQEMELLY